MQSGNQIISDILIRQMNETCRDEMEDHLFIDPIDSVEKTRVCLTRLYNLMKKNSEHLEFLESELDKK